MLPFLGPLLVFGYDTESKIRRIRVPVLIVHGDRDEVIAYEFGRKVFEAAHEPKSFWTIAGATHNDLHGSSEFPDRLKAFYLTVAKGTEDHAQ